MGNHFLAALEGQGELDAEQEALAAYYRAQQRAADEEEVEVPKGPPTVEEQFGAGFFDWSKIITSHLYDSLRAWEEATGQLDGMAEHAFGQYAEGMYNAIIARFLIADPQTSRFLGMNDVDDVDQAAIQDRRTEYFTQSQKGIAEMIEFGIQYMSGQIGAPLSLAKPRGSGRGSGARGPTAQDIRNQFDIEELSNAVDDMSRMLVFEPHKSAKKLARAYVELVVKGKGEKNIDFETFVRGDIGKTARFKSIYRNKPEALKAEQYMAPYFQMARSVAGPDEAADLAIGGAQFGASTDAFAQRLARTDAVTSSSQFINSLEGRLQDLNSIFKS